MGKYQAYTEYNHSGNEFVGVLPAMWERCTVGSVSNVIDPQPDHRAPEICSDGEGFPYIGIRDVNRDGTLNFDTARPVKESAVIKQEKSFSIEPNDIIFCKVGTLGLPRKIVPHGRCALSATLVLIKTKPNFISQFLLYALDSCVVTSQTDYLATGSTRAALGIQQIRRFQIPKPTVAEQTQIANFLDHETAKIDTLIEKQQQLIKLLKEKRQAVISHAVTKGLNPQAPMKDSGVEWLGEVPEHWEVKRLKNCLLAPMRNGLFKKKDQFGSGSLLVNVGDLYIPDNFISPSSLERVVTTKEEQQTYKVSSGDIFFVRSSLKLEGIGRSACFLEEQDDVVFECHIVNARPDKGQISPKYLTRYLNSELVSQEFIKRSKTTTMTTIDQGALSSITVLVPPLEEQLNVDAFLDKELGAIRIAVEKSELAIKLLTERRTALISSAVTGKIDVRNWQALTSQNQALEQTA